MQVIHEAVELQVSHVTRAIRLLVIPAQTTVDLHVAADLVLVLNVEALYTRVSVGDQLEVTNGRSAAHQERVVQNFGGRDRS